MSLRIQGRSISRSIASPRSNITAFFHSRNEEAPTFSVLFEVFPKSDQKVQLSDDARLRRVRIVRDYGMFDRREAPQYYPEVPRDTVQNT